MSFHLVLLKISFELEFDTNIKDLSNQLSPHNYKLPAK